jgi:putative spermidine/putrescine transport system substrate-binding protein
MNLTKREFLGLGVGALALSAMPLRAETIAELEAAAKAEGTIVSLGMPDDWANWGAMWKAITEKYGVTHSDTDMSSAEELAKFEAEKANPSADIGEVGLEFGAIAVARGLSQPYKTTTWDQIPDWAKDADGHWALGYTGTIAFLISKKVANPPKSFADLLTGDYKVTVGEVGKAAQSNAAVLAAAIALGGGEDDLSSAMDLFGKLAEAKRLLPVNASVATMEKGEVEVALVWDFNALNWRDQVGADKFDVVIPADGSVISGYTTTINAVAKHPALAKLTREFSLSDEGQEIFALGYARPIRIDHITLSDAAKAKVLPSEQYAKARPINAAVWTDAAKTLTKMWQEQVATKL